MVSGRLRKRKIALLTTLAIFLFSSITSSSTTSNYYPSARNLLGSTTDVSGAISNLQSNNAIYMIFRSYASATTDTSMLTDGFESVGWDDLWNENGPTNWEQSDVQEHAGSYSAHCVGATDDDLISDNMDMSTATSIYVEFWWYDGGLLDNNDAFLYFWDGTAYDEIMDFYDLTGGTSWTFYSVSTTDSQYFDDTFRICFEGTSMSSGEDLYIDDVKIKRLTPSEYTSEVEFTGTSNTDTWNSVEWIVDSCWTAAGVTVTVQLYNWNSGAYPTSGSGYMSYTSSGTPNTDQLKQQNIAMNPGYFREASTGNWKIKVKGVKSTTTQFDFKADYTTINVDYTVSNSVPSNVAGSITDMDDTNNLYAQRKWYTGSSSHTDNDGYADIDYCEFRLKQNEATRAIFRYDEDTNTFTVEYGSTTWDLDTTGSSAAESGTSITISWKFKPQFDAIEEAGLEIELYVVDDQPTSDTDAAQTNYFDTVTNLLTGSIECDDADNPDRVNAGDSVTLDFTVRYANGPSSSTASSFYPPDAEFTSVSIYDSLNSNEGIDNTIVNGAGSVDFTAPSTVGSDTYNLYINMADADYADGEESTTEQVITDQVVFLTGTTLEKTNGRVNADGSTVGEWYAELMFDYDDTEITSGTINLDSGTMSWDVSQGRWEYTTTSATVQSISRNIASVSGLNYGITSLSSTVTSDSEAIIFDRIEIVSVAFDKDWINPGDSAEVRYVLRYDYDDVIFDDTKGSITTFNWDGTNGWWCKTITFSSSATENYDENDISITDSTCGLTLKEDDAGANIIVGPRLSELLLGLLQIILPIITLIVGFIVGYVIAKRRWAKFYPET